MTKARIIPMVITLLAVLACTGKADDLTVVDPATELLKKGDIGAAEAEYTKIEKDSPQSTYAAEGAAYTKLLKGDFAGADAELQTAEKRLSENGKGTPDPKRLGEIKLRRALVALAEGNLDNVKQFGKDSGLPAGQLLAAEVHLADIEGEDALKLLKLASSDGGMVGETAKKYVELLESDDQTNRVIAENSALWALGQRDVAVEAAEDIIKGLPDDREDKNELLLLWAGRAVTSGRPGSAAGMLDAMSAPPPDQAWRVQATRAMIAIAQGENEDGLATFTALATALAAGPDSGVPADGLYDALATAAALTKDPEVAKQLAGSVESVAAARGLYEAGATDAAKEVVPSGSYSKFLGN